MPATEAVPYGADLVREVFTRVRKGDPDVADLYEENAKVLVEGRCVEGREAIRTFYRRTIEARHPQPDVQVVLESPGSRLFAAVVEVPMDGDLHVHAFDLFTIGSSGIEQLEIYRRPLD